MKSTLFPHYVRQLENLLAAELRFLAGLEDFLADAPSLGSCLAGIECDLRERIECLRLLTFANGGQEPPACTPSPLIFARGHTERRRMALRHCARQHRHLMNGYRIARELARRTSGKQQAERIDALLARMCDRFPPASTLAWRETPAVSELLAG
jgi:hypothetical protein